MAKKSVPRAQLELERKLRWEMGQLVRQAREALGLTQRALGVQVGFAAQQEVGLIERGAMPIPPERIRALEAILKLPRNRLLREECRARLVRVGFRPGELDQVLVGADERKGRSRRRDTKEG